MGDMMEYKCPACGGAMEFDTKTQNMKCPYCDTEISIEEYRKLQEKDESKSETWKAAGNVEWEEGEADGLRIYKCKSCGGEIIAEQQTGATSCPYCGNQVVMKEHFSGDLKPNYVIPFQFDKKEAKKAYYRHLEGKAFLPKIFKDENHIDEIKGLYVPFWLFDVSTAGSIRYEATRTRIWRSGNKEYTEHKTYCLERDGKMEFARIPADGSKKMDDMLMESIEPFDFSKAVPFTPEYLAGFLADRYDVDRGERLERVHERVRRSMEDACQKTIPAYDTVRITSSDVGVENGQYAYALYPVWLLSTSWNGQNFLFAMNGQTGKMTGDLPVDRKAFWRYIGTRTMIAAAVIHVLSWLIIGM